MISPYRIDGPAVISFSGGRTSAYMLRRVLEVGLQPDVHVVFANTGKERPETLDFVRDCSETWGVSIHWVEYRNADPKWTEVNYDTASRSGEPFEALITKRSYLPNPVTRFCTQEMKIRPMRDWMLARGYEHWTNVVGIRADEPRRVAKMRAAEEKRAERWDIELPLADAGVTEAEVMAFWNVQPFDLRLRQWEGNCDLCFLKGVSKRRRIIEDTPVLADWWIEQERRIGNTFRADTLSYARLVDNVRRQCVLPIFSDDPTELGDCVCHD